MSYSKASYRDSYVTGVKMSIGKYKAFCTAVELKSISKAAEMLNYTQSGASRMISSLEDEVGVPLLVRGRLGLELTPCGEKFYALARKACAVDAEIQALSASFFGLREGKLRIGTFSVPGTLWIPQMARTFSEKYPGIEFEIYNERCKTLVNWLTSGRIDMSFTAFPVEEKLECITLKNDPMVAVLPEHHHLCQYSEIPLSVFRHENYILTYRDAALSVFRAAKLSPNIRYTIMDVNTALAMVANGFGITMVPEMVLRAQATPGLVSRPLEGHYVRAFGIALPSLSKAAPAVKAFVAHAQQWVSDDF